MRVVQAKYINEYKIRILFSDGVCKSVDFAPFLKTAKHVFIPLKDIDYFKKFIVDDITLSWPNDADFDPELLYEMGEIISSTNQNSSTRHRKQVTGKTIRVKHQTACSIKKPKKV
jgi:hypothetical protein